MRYVLSSLMLSPRDGGGISRQMAAAPITPTATAPALPSIGTGEEPAAPPAAPPNNDPDPMPKRFAALFGEPLFKLAQERDDLLGENDPRQTMVSTKAATVYLPYRVAGVGALFTTGTVYYRAPKTNLDNVFAEFSFTGSRTQQALMVDDNDPELVADIKSFRAWVTRRFQRWTADPATPRSVLMPVTAVRIEGKSLMRKSGAPAQTESK